MQNLLLVIAIDAVILLPVAMIIGLLVLSRRLDKRRKRRSPLTTDLLRPPGWGLMERIDALRDEQLVDFLMLMLLPAVMMSIWFGLHSFGQAPKSFAALLVFVLLGVIAMIWFGVRIVRRDKVLCTSREGRDGEWATAQLLQPIIAGGGRVLHDIQAPGFNIDHVVVTPGGIFAIETKHRLKPAIGQGSDNAKVSFDGKALRFPDWTDTATADQAAAQARWLSERLTKATGLAVKARPVIALPGWFVTLTARADVWAINLKNCKYMLKPLPGELPLAPDAIQRIAYQVEQLCRLPDPDQRSNGRGQERKA